jgi:hypothetical protein
VDGGDGGSVAVGPNGGPILSACARSGAEVKIPTTQGTESFAVVWNKDHYLFAYSDPSLGNGDIVTIRVSPDGTAFGAYSVVQRTDAGSHLPSLLALDDGYVVAWQEGTAGKTVRIQKLDLEGKPSGEAITVGSAEADEARPVLTRGPAGVVVAWMDSVFGRTSVHMATLDTATMRVTTPVVMNEGGSPAAFPAIAGDQNRLAAIWSERREGQFDTRFAFLDSALAVTSEVSLRKEPSTGDALLGRVIKTGFGFMSAWEQAHGDENQIHMSLLDHAGQLIAEGVAHEPDTGDANWPNMAWTGSATGLVYYQWRKGGNAQIHLTVIDPKGKRIGADTQISATPRSERARFPDLVWNGGGFGVAWVDTRDGSPQLYFAKVPCKS